MKMINTMLASVAALALGTPAYAADIDVGINATSVTQTAGPVTQIGGAVAAAVGETGNNVDIAASTTNAVNAAAVDGTIEQANGGSVNGALNAGLITQTAVTAGQTAISVAGSGDLGAGSSITATATNVANAAAFNGTINMAVDVD
jgi:hypothetical protein